MLHHRVFTQCCLGSNHQSRSQHLCQAKEWGRKQAVRHTNDQQTLIYSAGQKMIHFHFIGVWRQKKGDPFFALSLRHSKLGPLSNFPFAFLGSTSCRPEAAGAEKFFAIKLDNALLLLSSLLVLSNAYTHTMRLHLNASLSSEYP